MDKSQYITALSEGELTDTITIDTAAIPEEIRDRLAAATLEMVRGIMRQPELRAELERRLAAKRAADSTGN